MKIAVLALFTLLIFSISGCDDKGCPFCTPASYCGPEELAENAAASVCLAEDYLIGFGCPNVGCFSRDPDINDGDLTTCEVIDCQTLSCEDMRVEFMDPEPGFITDISLEEMTGTPIGLFEVGDFIGDFRCLVFVP